MVILLKDLPKCKDCNKDIVYYDTIIKNGYVKKGKSALSKKNSYYLTVCEKCLTVKFPTYQERNKSRVFNRMCEETQYAYSIPDDVYQREKRNFVVKTLEIYIEKYGRDEGTLRWDSYRHKQSITNSFDYKREKYGMSKEDFDEYNKSRAITIKTLVTKYGYDEGTIKYNEYRAKQIKTKSWDYMVEKFGKLKATNINKSKALTLKNFQLKYGIDEGKNRYDNYLIKQKTFYSKISQRFFTLIDSYIGQKYTTYFGSKNVEYGVHLGDSYAKLDYYILELNLCIEFNGTTFHADPRVYEDTSHPNPFAQHITAHEMRNKDVKRYQKLEEKRGIKTVVMWELDFDEKNFNPLMYINSILQITI